MSLTKIPSQIDPRSLTGPVIEAASEVPWTRVVAAGSFAISAFLLFTGKRKAAIAVAAAGATAAVLENPEGVRELWEKLPDHLRTGQDLLVKAETFVEDVMKKGEKFQKAFTR
ncbi:hypothetical protein [Silvibacterium acidisoli]|uniref:hypothetical protein n=1 Tax=Acidobacteriaceae bacterium ZG23-2 TaxID=2883246 RepID=UPI00406CFB34